MFNSIINGDCLDVMKNIPDNSVHMVLCDLPFNSTKNHWDILINPDQLWIEYKRIIAPKGAILLFGIQPFSSMLVMSNLAWYKYQWIWKKSQAGNFVLAKKMPLTVAEDILVFGNGAINYYPIMTKRDKPRKNGGKSSSKNGRGFGKVKNIYTISTHTYPKNVLEYPVVTRSKSLHPSQKPVELLEYLIQTYTIEGNTVLDNACGSGSTLIAARNLNRSYIGIEKDKDIYQIALNRLGELNE